MTVETKTVFELGDIDSIEYECQNCRAKILRPVKTKAEHPQHLPLKCANCAAEFFTDGGRDSEEVRAMVNALTRFAGGVNNRVKIRFHIPHK